MKAHQRPTNKTHRMPHPVGLRMGLPKVEWRTGTGTRTLTGTTPHQKHPAAADFACGGDGQFHHHRWVPTREGP